VANGNVVARGHVNPGLTTAPSPVGEIQVQGGYSQNANGALDIDLGGLAATQYDRVDAAGGVTLGGALSVNLIAPFSPSLGDSFTIINNEGAEPVSGNFAGLDEGATASSKSPTRAEMETTWF